MFGQEKILDSLKAISTKKQLAFALLVFERMLPRLTAFSKDTGRDDSCFLQARHAAWQALQKDQESSVYTSLNEVCSENLPNTEDFSHDLTSDALNAGAVMCEIMEFMLDNRVDHLASILTLVADSVDGYEDSLSTSVLLPPFDEQRIAAYPLMQQELRREEEDIKFLAGLPDQFDDRAISTLRARASSQPPLLPLPR